VFSIFIDPSTFLGDIEVVRVGEKTFIKVNPFIKEGDLVTVGIPDLPEILLIEESPKRGCHLLPERPNPNTDPSTVAVRYKEVVRCGECPQKYFCFYKTLFSRILFGRLIKLKTVKSDDRIEYLRDVRKYCNSPKHFFITLPNPSLLKSKSGELLDYLVLERISDDESFDLDVYSEFFKKVYIPIFCELPSEFVSRLRKYESELSTLHITRVYFIADNRRLINEFLDYLFLDSLELLDTFTGELIPCHIVLSIKDVFRIIFSREVNVKVFFNSAVGQNLQYSILDYNLLKPNNLTSTNSYSNT